MSLNSQSLPSSCQTCPACGVNIDGEGVVHFSHGAPGTRERLYARVCRFAQAASCINPGDHQITSQDCYGLEEDRKLFRVPPPQPAPSDRRAA